MTTPNVSDEDRDGNIPILPGPAATEAEAAAAVAALQAEEERRRGEAKRLEQAHHAISAARGVGLSAPSDLDRIERELGEGSP